MTRERDQQKFLSGHVVPFVSLLLCTWLGTIGPGTAQQTPTASAPTSVVVPGTVQAFYATDLFAKESGYISQIHADIGDQVKKNQVLAVIETPELQQQLLRSRAAVQQAAAALDVAKRRLTGLQADRALQQATLKRTEQLFAGKAVTGQQLDEQRAKEGVSAANLGVGQADVALASCARPWKIASPVRAWSCLTTRKGGSAPLPPIGISTTVGAARWELPLTL